MNPYAVLGIDQSANAKTIRDAYRKLSAIHHPDSGGDRSKFEQIKLAHDILIDPQRRKRYDTTGRIDDNRVTPDRIEMFLVEMLRSCIEAVRADGSSDDPTMENIKDKILLSLMASRAPLRNDRFKLQRKLERTVRMIERFKPKADWDPIGKILKNERERIEHDLRINQDAVELSIEAERVLKTYAYDLRMNVGPGSEGHFNPGPTNRPLLGGSR